MGSNMAIEGNFEINIMVLEGESRNRASSMAWQYN